ncbi:MAG: hypothetical protein ACTSR2_02830 [Candidatus Hodarchaeales archaeon]
MPKKKTSEFGKGFVYNLILFAKHWWSYFRILELYQKLEKKHPDLFNEKEASTLWFSGASDHLYELEIPKQWKRKKIGRLAKWIKEKGLYWGHGFKEQPTKKDFEEFFEKLEELARLIDKELGVEDIEAEWR